MAAPLSYRASFVGLVALGIGAVVILIVFHPGDNTAAYASIFAFVSSTLALLKVNETSAKVNETNAVVNETHAIVNSRMDEFKRLMEKAASLSTIAAHAEGVVEGREAANVRTDQLAAEKQ